MGRARPRLSFSACLGSQVHVRFGGMCCKTILSIRTRNIETRFYFSWVEMLVNVVLSWPLPRGRLIQKDQQPAKAIPREIILLGSNRRHDQLFRMESDVRSARMSNLAERDRSISSPIA